MAKKKGKGRGWHGDSAGHAAAAKKSGKGKKKRNTGGKTPSGKLSRRRLENYYKKLGIKIK